MLNTIFKILFILCISLIFSKVGAQNIDSLSIIDSKYDSILRSDGESMNTLFYKHRNDVLINNLGPYGSPFYVPTTSYLYSKSLIEKPNSFKMKLYELSGFRPFTNITYINASRKEQHFYIKHVQEFGKLLYFDFDFKKVSSPGAYTNQEANNTSFEGLLKYSSKKNNYTIEFRNGVARNFYEENGGLFDSKNYENSLFDDEQNYNVYLLNSNAFLKKYNYHLDQRFDLFNLKTDSNARKVIYLKHNVSYTTQQKVFFDRDPLSAIYNYTYFDSISSVDSIYFNNISNTSFIGFRNSSFTMELFGQYDQLEYLQNAGINSIYHNTYGGLVIGVSKKKFKIDVIGKYGVDGRNKGDIESELMFSFDKDKINFIGGIGYFLNEPVLKFESYTSNHFIWESSFDKQSLIDFSLDLELIKLQLEFSAESKFLSNTFYFDSLAIASQDNNSSSISTFSLAKNYKLLNFYFRTAIIYQITSNEILLPLPDVIGRQIVYYQKYIFKGALKFQFGIGFSYSTEYYGYAYMPAINEFYVQQNTKLGYYPKVDVFINTHLKRAQIFLKYEHINAGSSLPKSYITPGYPSMSKSLKFGVSWNMFD